MKFIRENIFCMDCLVWLLPASVIFFLPFGSLLYAPLVIMALIGLITIFHRKLYRTCWHDPDYRFLFCIFALIWLPMLFSLTDAVNPVRSVKSTLSVLPYLLVGIYILYYLNTEDARNKLNLAILFITSFWCFDALVQLLFGVNLFGNEYISDNRLSGIFYPGFTLGLVLAVLFPVVLETLRKMVIGNKSVALAIILASIHISVVILSGSRNALIMLVVGLAGWFIYTLYIQKNINWPRIVTALIVGIPVILLLSVQQPSRIDTLTEAEDLSLKTLDRVSNHRLALWEAAARISSDHWINGIGPRGFRYAYTDYRPDEGKYNFDYDEKGSTHPHFALLEIFAETGMIGLTGMLLMLFFLFKKLNRLVDNTRLLVFPWFWGVVIAIIPNIAKSFYSSFWMSIVLCMLFIGIANISGRNEKN